jgi:hypothetical protein
MDRLMRQALMGAGPDPANHAVILAAILVLAAIAAVTYWLIRRVTGRAERTGSDELEDAVLDGEAPSPRSRGANRGK